MARGSRYRVPLLAAILLAHGGCDERAVGGTGNNNQNQNQNQNAGCPGPAQVTCCDGMNETMPECRDGGYHCPAGTWMTPPGQCEPDCGPPPAFFCCNGAESAEPVCGEPAGWTCPPGSVSQPDMCEGPPSDCPCAGGVPVVTVDDLMSSPDSFIGENLRVVGLVGPDPVATNCTQIACTPDNPCCNACGSSLMLRGLVDPTAAVMVQGDDPFGGSAGCGGNECQLWCRPMVESHRYCVGGTFTAEPNFGGYYLQAFGPAAGTDYCPTECEPLAPRPLPCQEVPFFSDPGSPLPPGCEDLACLTTLVQALCPEHLSAGGLSPEMQVDFWREQVVVIEGDVACTGRLSVGSGALCPTETTFGYCVDTPPFTCDAVTPEVQLVAIPRTELPLAIAANARFLSQAEFDAGLPCP